MNSIYRVFFFYLAVTFISATGLEAKKQTSGTPYQPEVYQQSHKYALSIGCIFQDDSKYLPEWIEFHYSQGVEHFYLYNNKSHDNYKLHLQPYILQGLVDLIEWPFESTSVHEWNDVQCSAYMHCIQEDGGKSKWIAILDSDEFLFSPTGSPLPEILANFKKFSGVSVNWVMYGTSGVASVFPGEKLIEKLTMRGFLNRGDNKHVKTIVRPKDVVSCTNPHYFHFKEGCYAVRENKEPIYGPLADSISVSFLRINHYWSRDRDFFFNHKIPRRSEWGQDVSSCIEYEKGMNEEFDDCILLIPASRTLYNAR